jgi:hypothetical protein
LNTQVYFRDTPISTNFTFEFIRRPISPILSPSSRTFVELTLVTHGLPVIWKEDSALSLLTKNIPQIRHDTATPRAFLCHHILPLHTAIVETSWLLGNRMKIWKRKWNFAKRKQKWRIFGGSRNGKGIAFSDGTDTKMEFPFPTNAQFLFCSGFAWSI